MSAINDLIAQIDDEELRQRIDSELKRLLKQKKFGLVFEDHMPEGLTEGAIYPCLKVLDELHHAPEKALWHALIEADNYYALQLLAYLYPGMVDCIYIDPPYNTGARDWKYNNDYVDSSDQYRHSKWLSMMKRRLLLAKKLLNPRDSVLIVTIDEKEYLHLGCLLEELFPEARMQMVTSVINAKGVARVNQFSRVEEYIYICEFGNAAPSATNDSMLDFEITGNYKQNVGDTIPWARMLRRGSNSHREHSENCFYPIFVNESKELIDSVGLPPGKGISRDTTTIPNGCIAVWPMHDDGIEGCWQLSRPKFLEALEKGTAKLGRKNKIGQWSINYLNKGILDEISNGSIIITGKDEKGAVILQRKADKLISAKSVWTRKSHDASLYGSVLLSSIVGKRFSYPKSLYAVHDTIRFFVANKPNALIVDFFAGSGTTLHAVNLLNAEDGGNRRCILVTNNEVSEQETKTLKKQGFKPGDEEWERLGIARYVTWPRTVCSIEGHDVNGQPLKGEYLGTDHRQMKDGFEANCIFFKLDFLDKTQVALGRQFRELLTILWMKAGGEGQCPTLSTDEVPGMMILPENRFAVLTDEKAFGEFVGRVNQEDDIRMVYLVVDSESMFKDMARCFRDKQTCQLYRDYLDNFRINQTRQTR